MDDLNILIKAKLASTVSTDINTQINELNTSKKITSAISVKLNIDAKDLTIINDTMEKIKKATSQSGGKITIFNEKDLKDQGIKYKQGVMRTIEDVEKYLQGAYNGKKFDLGPISTNASKDIKSFEATIKSTNGQLEKVKFNLAEIARESAKTGKVSTNSGYVLDSSQLSRIAVKPEQIFDRAKLDEEGRKFFFNSKNVIDRVKAEFSTLGQVNVFETLNSKSKLTSFIAEITKANGVVEKLQFNMAKIQTGSSTQSGFIFIGEKIVDKNAGANLDTLKNKMQSFTNQLERMKTGFTSPATGITDPQNLNNLIAKYDQVKATINQVLQSSTNLSSEQRRGIVQNLADLRLQITEYKDLQRAMAKSNGSDSKQGNWTPVLTDLSRLSNVKTTIVDGQEVQRIATIHNELNQTLTVTQRLNETTKKWEESTRVIGKLNEDNTVKLQRQLELAQKNFTNRGNNIESQYVGSYDVSKLEDLRRQASNLVINPNLSHQISILRESFAQLGIEARKAFNVTTSGQGNMEKTLDKLQLYENKIAKLKTGFTSPATGIKDPENLAILIAQHDRLKVGIDQIRSSNTFLSNEQRRGILQNIANLELEITKYKDLQRIATTADAKTLSPKDISLYQAEMQNKINSLQVGKSTVFSQPAIQQELTRLTENIVRFGTAGSLSAREVNLQFAQLTTSVRAATAEITRINGAADSVFTTFGKDIFKLGIWSNLYIFVE